MSEKDDYLLTSLEYIELIQLLKRNDTYKEKSKQKEEDDRIKEGPMMEGGWQSISENDRWNQLYKDVDHTRLTYNIEKSPTKEEEKQMLLKTKISIQYEFLQKQKEYKSIQVPESPTWIQQLYSRWVGESNYDKIHRKQSSSSSNNWRNA
jgi:hypothetical protein